MYNDKLVHKIVIWVFFGDYYMKREGNINKPLPTHGSSPYIKWNLAVLLKSLSPLMDRPHILSESWQLC